MISRSTQNTIFTGLTCAAFFICTGLLCGLIITIIFKGLPALSLSFLFSPAQDFGASGGILYQILGTLLMVIVAAIFVVPIALGSAIYSSEYLRSHRKKRILELSLLALNGVPSITFGLFGLILFVNILGTGISWMVGSIILAIMMVPTTTLSTLQSMQSLPMTYRENGYALGFNRSQVIRYIVIPQGLQGLVTGLLIGLARAIGETAPIMFIATAFSGVTVPISVVEPVSTLPTHILSLTQQATNPDALKNAWGASLVLIILVFIISLSAFYARSKLKNLSQRV